MSRDVGHNALAISAFHLSSLPTALARKQMVKEMWESGAHTLVSGTERPATVSIDRKICLLPRSS